MIVPVILSGGTGTRLWPLSRASFPKQFINLVNEKSIIQETVLRIKEFNNISEPVIICNQASRFVVAHQMQQINSKVKIILEPQPKSTLPPVVAAAYSINLENPDALLLIMPSDQLIKNVAVFKNAVEIGVSAAKKDKIVTFGIVPDRPETGYGYINFDAKNNEDYFTIKKFKEKPDLKTAEKYLSEGNYLWNSGIFLVKASALLEEVQKKYPELYENAKKSIIYSTKDLYFTRLSAKDFSECPDLSFDCGIMEKTKNGVVVPMDAGWSDIGTWDSIWRQLNKDKSGNYIKGDVILENCCNSYFRSENKLICATEVENLIVVDTEDALFISAKDKIKSLSKIVDKLKKSNRKELTENKIEYKPWGTNHHIEQSNGYKINHLIIEPGERPTIHYHLNYTEHWVILSGKATITINETVKELSKGESIYIPVKQIHGLQNLQKEPLHVLEIQIGDDLDSYDIKKITDFYK